jgi:hypothetical protein
MARWAIERRVEDPEQLKDFAEEGYRFSVEASETQVWVFRRLVGEPDADRHPDRYPDRNLDRNPDPNSD